MLEEKLIKEVQQNECLWNKYNPDYKNKHKKDVCWSCVSNNIGESVESCRKRWKALRDRFIIEMSTRNKACGNLKNNNTKKDWIFFEQLFFLTANMSPKASQQATQTYTDLNLKKCKNLVDPKDKKVEASSSSVTMDPNSTPSFDVQRYANLDETIRTLVENYLKFVNAYKQSADPFLAVIQEFFDKVPEHKRMAFKMDILNYTYKMYAEIKD